MQHRFEYRQSRLSGVELMRALSARTLDRHTHDHFGIGVIDYVGYASLSDAGQVEALAGDRALRLGSPPIHPAEEAGVGASSHSSGLRSRRIATPCSLIGATVCKRPLWSRIGSMDSGCRHINGVNPSGLVLPSIAMGSSISRVSLPTVHCISCAGTPRKSQCIFGDHNISMASIGRRNL
jgi:hypothetical protein